MSAAPPHATLLVPMSMSTVTVTGATGAQGGAVVRALAAQGQFRVRAMVRDVASAKAQQLGALPGVDLIAADFNDGESLRAAFSGADYAFLNTDYWSSRSAQVEQGQIRSLADVCKECGVKYVVWSTLDDSRTMLAPGAVPVLQDGFLLPHYDVKGSNDAYFTSLGLPTTCFLTSPYYENLLSVFAPRRDETGELVFTLAMGSAKMALIAAEDIGKAAASLFKNPTAYANAYLGVYTEALTGDEIAETMTEVLGMRVQHRSIDPDEYRFQDLPGAQEIANMFVLWRDAEEQYIGKRSNEIWTQLDVKPLGFREWLEQNKHLFERL